jgi:MraZ protein
VTRKTQLGWLTAGAALGFASVMFGPKLLDRLHSRASAETKPEKAATAFDQVAQVWTKPKGGSEEQEPPVADSTPSKKVDKEPAKALDLPKNSAPANELPPPDVAVDEKVERPTKEPAPPKEVQAITELRTPSLPDDPLPPQDKVAAEPTEKPSIRLRATETQPVEPPPVPPKTEEVKSSAADLPKDSPIPPQADLGSPPPVPEKRPAPKPQPAVEVSVPQPSTPAIPDSRPPDLNDVPASVSPPRKEISDLKNVAAPSTIAVKTIPTAKKAAAPAKAKALPLTGQHPCMLDDTRALVLPKSVRDQMGETDVLFLTPGADQALWLTTAATLEKLTDKLEKKTESAEDGKLHSRRYFALTERVTVDKTGRLVLPAALATAAELKQEVVLIGVGDHIEVWDAARWQKYCQAEGE